MLRSEIRLVDLDPSRRSAANKRRPAVIVSNDRANSIAARLGRGVVTVVPVTSNTDRIFPFQTFLPAAATGLRQDAKAQAEQVRWIAVERLGAVLREPQPRSWRRRRIAPPPPAVGTALQIGIRRRPWHAALRGTVPGPRHAVPPGNLLRDVRPLAA
ncbi:type II toxin-antitoxin system PemK/MazF family toxin [Georgenia sp. M64]|uniref:type II toxin-antitoxin system PemK/MazF family toxin n=1 Tax=Georgenia sp. M64 TaxID=3120520 RepID=UPI0030E4D7E4